MNIYEVDFEGIWPVGNCLIIAAKNSHSAIRIAKAAWANKLKAMALG